MSRLYPCVYCTEDGYCKKYSDEEVTSWCVQGPCKDERPSNADRIRAMTDEELAHAFAYQCAGRVCRGIPFDGPNECENCWLEWLKKEADNGK